jgi:hypothetical protein
MKKIVLSIAGVMAVAAFAPEASALPLFARQTGMACSACHFQHFPLLNGFGRSFKAAAFTMMGAQGKVEGDKLSLPETLNMAVLTTAGYTKNNTAAAAGVAAAGGIKTAGNGNVYVPGTNGEFSLFIGGRTSEFSGALAEIGLTQLGGAGAGVASAKFPMLWAMGDARVGVVPFTTDAQGASYGFEELNTGANSVHTMMFAGGDFNGSIGPALSAQQYIGTNGFATGAALVANSDMGFINVTKYHMAGPAALAGTGANLGSTYLRVAGTFDLAGWDSAVGFQSWSGSSFAGATLKLATTGAIAAATKEDTKAYAIDGQMQGELGGMPVGFYASYASASAGNAVTGNAYNNGGSLLTTGKRSSFNVSAEVGVLPEVATLGVGFRSGKSGINSGSLVAGANDTDNAFLLAGTYKLQQNMMLQLVYTKQSGVFWSAANAAALGSTQTAINLATLF